MFEDGNKISGEWNKDFPNLDPDIAEKIIQSDVEGGIMLENLPVGKVLIIPTENHTYRLEHREDGFYISGHPKYCPEPTLVFIRGSKYQYGGSMIKLNFIGRKMFLEGVFLERVQVFETSEIQDLYIEGEKPEPDLEK